MRKYNDRRRGFRSRTSAGDVTVIVAASLFGVMLVSNLILEIITISEVGGLWEFMQLSDFGILLAQFGVHPVWAAVNIVGTLTSAILFFASR